MDIDAPIGESSVPAETSSGSVADELELIDHMDSGSIDVERRRDSVPPIGNLFSGPIFQVTVDPVHLCAQALNILPPTELKWYLSRDQADVAEEVLIRLGSTVDVGPLRDEAVIERCTDVMFAVTSPGFRSRNHDILAEQRSLLKFMRVIACRYNEDEAMDPLSKRTFDGMMSSLFSRVCELNSLRRTLLEKDVKSQLPAEQQPAEVHEESGILQNEADLARRIVAARHRRTMSRGRGSYSQAVSRGSYRSNFFNGARRGRPGQDSRPRDVPSMRQGYRSRSPTRRAYPHAREGRSDKFVPKK
jgi:hypothetical protein